MIPIPDSAMQHLAHVAKTTSRKFNLDEDNEEELYAHLRYQMLMATKTWKDGNKATLETYLSRVVDFAAVRWRKQRYAEACAQPLDAIGSPYGYDNNIDDSEFSREDKWVFDEEQELAEDDVGYEAPRQAIKSYRYYLKLIDFRAFCELLTPVQRKIVRRHLQGDSLAEIATNLNLSNRRFYAEWKDLKHRAEIFYHDDPKKPRK